MQMQRAAWPQTQHFRCAYRLQYNSREYIPRTHLQGKRLPQRHSKGCRPGRLRVQAGLNYPHMPTRMRRQIQEIRYTAQLYISRFFQLLATLPGIRNVVRAWKDLEAKLTPYIERWRQRSADLKEEYLRRVDKYDEFCLEELKRKYRWKAYSQRDEKLVVGFLKTVFYRLAVILCIAEWEYLAPGGFLWTCIAPLIIGRALLDEGDPIWWGYCAVILIAVIIRHPIDFPLQLI